jgi:hypothetical protein
MIALIKSLRIACGCANGPVVARMRLQISTTSVACARTSSATTAGSLLMISPDQFTVATNGIEQTLKGRPRRVALKSPMCAVKLVPGRHQIESL